MISLIINGDEHDFDGSPTLYELLEELNIDPGKVAVERNLEIVPKTTYQQVRLEDGDQLEIVHFIGGGKID
nr:sulfur carrier protein ThiS [Emcibacter sp.]